MKKTKNLFCALFCILLVNYSYAQVSCSQVTVVNTENLSGVSSTSYTRNGLTSSVFVANSVRNVRGIFVNCNRGIASTNPYNNIYWKKFFTLLGFAVMNKEGRPTDDARVIVGGLKEAEFLIEAINSYASFSNHPEMKYAPILFWGHSGSSKFATSFGDVYPQRTLAGMRFHGGAYDIGDITPNMASVPTALFVGQNDNSVGYLDVRYLWDARSKGALWTSGIELGLPHGDGSATSNFFARNTILWPWMMSVLPKRMPTNLNPYTAVPSFKPLSESAGYLGKTADFNIGATGTPYVGPAYISPANTSWVGPYTNPIVRTYTERFDNVAPFNSYIGDRTRASWLADQTMADVWTAYVTRGNDAARAINTVMVLPRSISTVGSVKTIEFAVVRASDYSRPLTVNYSISSSICSQSYNGTVSILANEVGAIVKVNISTTGLTGSESIVFAINPSVAYKTFQPASTSVSLGGNVNFRSGQDEINNLVSLFPNMGNGRDISLSYEEKDLQIAVKNVHGVDVKSNYSMQEGKYIINLDEDAPAGLYTIIIKSQEGVLVKKYVKK